MNFGGRGEGSGAVHCIAVGKCSVLAGCIAAPAKEDPIKKKRTGVGWQLAQFPCWIIRCLKLEPYGVFTESSSGSSV